MAPGPKPSLSSTPFKYFSSHRRNGSCRTFCQLGCVAFTGLRGLGWCVNLFCKGGEQTIFSWLQEQINMYTIVLKDTHIMKWSGFWTSFESQVTELFHSCWLNNNSNVESSKLKGGWFLECVSAYLWAPGMEGRQPACLVSSMLVPRERLPFTSLPVTHSTDIVLSRWCCWELLSWARMGTTLSSNETDKFSWLAL